MKYLLVFLLLSIQVQLSATEKDNRSKDQLGQNLLSNQTKKVVEDMKKEMDKVLDRYEEKLDDQLEKVEDKMDAQVARLDDRFDEIQEKLDNQVSKAEGRLDQTFDKVDQEMGDVKSTLLGTVGTIAWRFTIVDIVTAFLATFLTAFLTSYLTVKKMQVGQFKKELNEVMADLKKDLESIKQV